MGSEKGKFQAGLMMELHWSTGSHTAQLFVPSGGEGFGRSFVYQGIQMPVKAHWHLQSASVSVLRALDGSRDRSRNKGKLENHRAVSQRHKLVLVTPQEGTGKKTRICPSQSPSLPLYSIPLLFPSVLTFQATALCPARLLSQSKPFLQSCVSIRMWGEAINTPSPAAAAQLAPGTGCLEECYLGGNR